MDSLWRSLTVTEVDSSSVLQQPNAPDLHFSRGKTACQQLQPCQLVPDEADSCDSLLSEGFDLWQQLTATAANSLEPSYAKHSPPDNAASPSFESALPSCGAPHRASIVSNQAMQQKQSKEVRTSNVSGVSLPSLLSFVQLIQQHSSGACAAPAAQRSTVDSQHSAELYNIARICSQNKQANMAYMGIGNMKVHQQPQRQVAAAACVPAEHALNQQQDAIHSSRWRPGCMCTNFFTSPFKFRSLSYMSAEQLYGGCIACLPACWLA